MAQSEFEPQRITQQEAAEMVELWTRESEGAVGTVDLRDVLEVLHISEADGQRLLARVRRESEPTRLVAPSLTKAIWKVLLGVCLFYAAMVSITAIQLVELPPEAKAFVAAGFLAVLGLLWYNRRPISRVFGGFGRRIAQGKP